MKRTLLATIDFPPDIGGVATYWKQVVTSVPKDSIVVLTIHDRDETGDSLLPVKIMRDRLFYKYIWPHWLKGVFKIRSAVRSQLCEQVLVGQLLPVGSMAYYARKWFKIPYSVQIYGMDLLMAQQHPRKEKLAKKILRSADTIFVNTNRIGELVAEFMGGDIETNVIYPFPKAPIDVDASVKKELIDRYDLKGKKIVLTLGRLVPRKGQDVTLGAMLHVWQTHPDAVYVIAGGGSDMDRLRKMAEPHKDHVIFTGWIEQEQRNAWLDLCDMMVMPARETESDIEGFGIVYLEANSLGKPVIGGKSGGVKEAVIDGETGYLVSPNDTDELAVKIIELLDHPTKAKTLGKQGQDRLKKHSWEEEVKKLMKALN